MKIDFHMHTRYTRKAEFTIEKFEKMVKVSKKQHLDAITLTEHFNVSNFPDIFTIIEKKYTYNGNFFEVNGCKVFPGIEVDVEGNANILMIGKKEDVIEISQILHNIYAEEENYIKLQTLIELGRKRNMLLIGAHPYRKNNTLYQYEEDMVKRLDAVEFNGADYRLKDKMQNYSKKLEMPMTAGSDAHTIYQIGTVANCFTKDCNSVVELRKEIRRKKILY